MVAKRENRRMQQPIYPWVVEMKLVEEARLSSEVSTPPHISSQDFPFQSLTLLRHSVAQARNLVIILDLSPSPQSLIGY